MSAVAQSGGTTDPRIDMLRGSAVLLCSSGLVSAANLLYNIIIARDLGPAGFGHATAIYTVLMLLSALTLAFQLVCSKLVAKSIERSTKAAIYRNLLRRSWQIGVLLGTAIVAGSTEITSYLHLPAARDIVLLGVGTAIYVPLGVRRGMLQGVYDFTPLAVNFVLEASTKFVAAVLLLHYRLGVTGVIAAVVVSIAIAYMAAYPRVDLKSEPRRKVQSSVGEGMQAAVFFVGQVIISNVDILLVKHYFAPEIAGLYAVVALVGRVVYMSSWSVISSMFPISAATIHKKASKDVLESALVLVTGMTLCFTLAAYLAPLSLWRAVLGRTFLDMSHASFSSLLGSYSAMTSIYALAVVLLAYEMSRRIVNATWIQLTFSGLLPLGIALFHESLHQVIMVQLLLMLGLLVAVSIPFWAEITSTSAPAQASSFRAGFVKSRRVPEAEVIAEFLRAEFYENEFDLYRDRFSEIVFHADLTNERENHIRRVLLFRRRGRLWRELPADTEWWEIDLQPGALSRVRVFPRKQWRKFAEGDFYLAAMIANIKNAVEDGSEFSEKLRSVVDGLRRDCVPNSVLLIGVDESSPLTIIEGNHRMAAAMLIAPTTVSDQFRFYCGLSSRMTECCWYRTDLNSLTRYAGNIIRHMFRDHDYFVQKTLRHHVGETLPWE